MGVEKLDVFCGGGRKTSCCPQLEKPKAFSRAQMVSSSSAWRGLLEGFRAGPIEEGRGDRTHTTSIRDRLRGESCASVSGAFWKTSRWPPESPVTAVMQARGVGREL